MKNFFLIALLLSSILSLVINYVSIKSSKWRHVKLVDKKTNQGFYSTFGFWKMCNETISSSGQINNTVCADVPVNGDFELLISRVANYIGFTFQIIGTIAIIGLCICSLTSYTITLKYNLNLILSAVSTVFCTIGLNLMLITAIFYTSKTKAYQETGQLEYYELGIRSVGLFGFFFGNMILMGVMGLVVIVLSTSTLKKTKIATEESVDDPRSSPSRTNVLKKKISEKNFKFASQPSFPTAPPPPPPPAFSDNAEKQINSLKIYPNLNQNQQK
ncbi:unnamed protein product [Brachionus calyciflorus]|uniref:Uncharacterized protein n=1 Tax=Brachionus calyciflorus TaxID=104777 RepID=A0A813S897_9BILA|nr:unnamed protein product [Brachionus calyciflorus]